MVQVEISCLVLQLPFIWIQKQFQCFLLIQQNYNSFARVRALILLRIWFRSWCGWVELCVCDEGGGGGLRGEGEGRGRGERGGVSELLLPTMRHAQILVKNIV